MRYRIHIDFQADSVHAANAMLSASLKGISNLIDDYGVELVEEDAETIVFTDGGCDMKRGGVGAWAYMIRFPDKAEIEGCQGFLNTTNNRMELMACIKALEVLEIGKPIRIVTDSEYLIKGLTQWSRKWRRNGWINSTGQPVMNRDLWEPLIALYELHKVRFEHVKGHTGHPENEHVDDLCTAKLNECHALAVHGQFTTMDKAA